MQVIQDAYNRTTNRIMQARGARNTLIRAGRHLGSSWGSSLAINGASLTQWVFDPTRDENACVDCMRIPQLHPLTDDDPALKRGTDGARYCAMCWNARFYECCECGKEGESGNAYIPVARRSDDPDDDEIAPRHVCRYCHDCYTRTFWNCNRCMCAFDVNGSEERRDVGRYPICENCWEAAECFTCESCDNNFYGSHYGRDGECQNCCSIDDDDDDNPSSSSLIRDYGPTRNLPKVGDPKDGIYFGVELEVQTDAARHVSAEHTKRQMGDFIVLKSDGSIGSSGYEIVTCPATLDVHKTKWAEFFAHPPRETYSWKTGDCGMHVHVSRKPLSQLTICKVGAFLNENKTFTEQIAGRTGSSWAKIQPKGKLSAYQPRYAEGRYAALNLESGSTIEFRIFRGTMKAESFYRNLEFCHALVYFARGNRASMRDLKPAVLARYVRENRKLYPHLDRWLSAKGLLTPVKVKPATVMVAEKEEV